ncbi:MAG: HD domain-containing protein, partial [Succinivibrio sp.]
MGEPNDNASAEVGDAMRPSEAVLKSPNLHYYIHLRELVSSYLSADDVAAVDRAFVMADNAHSKQRRASGEPYIIHPIAVADIVAKMHLDAESVQAALLHDVPVIVDELQSKGAPGGQGAKRQVVEDLLYSLSLGHERGALKSDRSMMRAGSWRCLTIATGEIPIVGGSTQQGAANRTLELNAEPFSDVREAQAMHHLVAAQHGTAGRTFVRSL